MHPLLFALLFTVTPTVGAFGVAIVAGLFCLGVGAVLVVRRGHEKN